MKRIKIIVDIKEATAWRNWCLEFENSTRESINSKKFNKLVALIEKWGIEYSKTPKPPLFQGRLE